MNYRLSFTALALASCLSASAVAADVEVLAKGIVHEAYAMPSEREPAPTPIIPKEPPQPIEELPPDQKPEGDNVQWMPGYWAWDDDKKDHVWISGFWRNAPPGRTWVPGSWRKVDDGWQWSGGFWADAKDDKAEVDYLPQPPAPLDNRGATTPAPSEEHVYVPGSWVWRDRYVWRPGFWAEYRPGWVWTAAHYRWTPAGYVFIDGYWDYPLAQRGILFAPVYIPPVVYTAPTFVYTPTVVVREECLYGAFFARRGFGCYYFGDYFAPTYSRIGFVAWSGHMSASVTIGGWYDPLYSYYRCGYRHDPFWRGGIANLYVGRYRGDYLRPPTTLVQQNTVINNITVNNSNNVNVNNVTMLTSLNDVGRGGGRSLRSLSAADRQAQRDAARSVRDVANRRAELENEIAAAPRGKAQSAALRRTLPVAAPKAPAAPQSRTTPNSSNLNPRNPGTRPTPKSPTTARPTPPSPPAPKATPLGRVNPKSPSVPPVQPKSPPGGATTRPKGPSLPTARPPVSPGARPTLKSPPAPKSATPVPKPVAPTRPSLPTPRAPITSPSTPKFPTAPSVSPRPATPTPRPPAASPVAPRPTPTAPRIPIAPSVAPRPTSPLPRTPSRPSIAPRPTPSTPRSAIPQRPATTARPAVPSRPTPAPRVNTPPATSYRPAPAARPVAPSVRSIPSRSFTPPPAARRSPPAVSRPAPRSAPRPPIQSPARPATPKKGKR